MLYIFQSPADLAHEMEMLTRFAGGNLSFQGPIVGDDLRQMEPNLSEKVHGGVWLTQERSVRPDSVTNALESWLVTNGVEIRSRVRVEGLTISRDRVTDVVFDHGRLETDAVLIAAGAWSPQIARYAKRRVPIQGGKGYSLDYTPSPVEVRHPLHVHDYRHVVTPLDGMTRVAGTMEFSGINEIIRPERVEAIVNWRRQYHPRLADRSLAAHVQHRSSPDVLGRLAHSRSLAGIQESRHRHRPRHARPHARPGFRHRRRRPAHHRRLPRGPETVRSRPVLKPPCADFVPVDYILNRVRRQSARSRVEEPRSQR